MKVLTCLLMIACGNSSLTMWTGHVDQDHLIQPAFQHSMEYTKDGATTYWKDDSTHKSGYIKPLYHATKFKMPCRHFEIAYFDPGKSPKHHYGIGCRRGGVWKVQ